MDHVCHDYLHDPATPWWGITFLVVSNFFFAWTSIKAYYHRFYLQSAINLSVVVFSSFYHACKPVNGWCILPYFILYNYDFFFALINLPLVSHYFLPYHTPILYFDPEDTPLASPSTQLPSKQDTPTITLVSHTTPLFELRPLRSFTGFLNKEVIQFVMYGIVIGIIISTGLINIYGYLILMGLVVLELAVVILFVRYRFGQWPFFHWGYMITGVVLLALGAFSFIMQDFIPAASFVYIYSIIHPIWHIISAVGQVLLIDARIYRPKPDILEQLKARDIDVEHLNARDVDDITLTLYGDREAVRHAIRFRKRQKDSFYTVI